MRLIEKKKCKQSLQYNISKTMELNRSKSFSMQKKNLHNSHNVQSNQKSKLILEDNSNLCL